jgi:16S rRNA (uracil1498-N3)-methyltransferase
MSRRRFLVAEIPEQGATLRLEGEEHHHLSRVLRLREGEQVRVFDGRGRESMAAILAVERRETVLRVERCLDSPVESPLETLLVQSFAAGARVDLALRRSTELGIGRVAVLEAERSRSTGRRPGESRLRHWRRIAAEACKQSGRRQVPEIFLVRAGEAWPAPPAGGPGLLLDSQAGEELVSFLARIPAPAGVALAVGPEGGWGDGDRERAEAAGYWPLRLGPRILRTETAGPAALALVQASWGDLR